MIENKRIIIPIWVNVTPQTVYDYSADLADTFVINWNEGIDKFCNKLANLLG